MSNLPPDPWRVLGIEKSADKSEIRTAYRKLVLKCHPDKVQDPTLKAQKQDEFQKVQQAYELLNDDTERAKYEEQVKLAEMRKAAMHSKNMPNIAVSRTPPRPSHTFYEVRTAEPPREPRFRHASPHSPVSGPPKGVYTHVYASAAKSHDDDVSHRSQALYDEDRRARRAASYEQPSRRDDDKREERRRRDARDRREEEERDRERERREKELRKQDRREREKTRDKEKRRDVEDKTSRRVKDAYVEEYHDRDIREVYPPPPKPEKKKTSSSLGSKNVDEPREKSSSRREQEEAARVRADKLDYLKDQAAAYIERRKVKPPPPLGHRSQTFQESPTYTRPRSPPPVQAVYVDDEAVRRSRARSRRPSHDTGAKSQEKLYSPSQKKSREDIEVIDTSPRVERVVPSRGAERPPTTLRKSNTMPTTTAPPPAAASPDSPPRRGYSRPPPQMPSITRSATYAGEKLDRYPVIHGEYEPSDDETYEGRRRHRSSRRAHSPEPLKSTRRYRVKDGMGPPAVETVYEPEVYDHYEDHRSSRRHGSSYGPGVVDPGSGYYYATEPSVPFGKIKTSKEYTENDVQYGNWATVRV
ncbi:DnaJ-domain-containing protein [Coniochaeta hoffmannii]|uniref:DnaJ-domain-containing protein n=1 Tax=Coniochaeta hoffmannii TaxID=91930 RepID=A0AA38R4G6_9PEZI|nr:DnaJ-domain-containing protein [Coniochaeta hoffmannii]